MGQMATGVMLAVVVGKPPKKFTKDEGRVGTSSR